MISYLIKVILCSGFLLAGYHLFLEKEKMHRFSRFYLLFSILFPFIAPLLKITRQATVLPEPGHMPLSFLPGNDTPGVASSSAIINWPLTGMLIAYGVIVLLLLTRFTLNLLSIRRCVRKYSPVAYRGARLITITGESVPHAFLHYIFAPAGTAETLLTHELAHVRQHHSLDILFVELVKTVCWFNPFLILYKRAIRLNHEFLADDSVLKGKSDVRSYQYLLLHNICSSGSISLASHLNFAITKKRLIMMTKTTSPLKALSRQLILIPFLASAAFLFATSVEAQQQPPARKAQLFPAGKGASLTELKEYQDVLQSKGTKIRSRNGFTAYELKDKAATQRIREIHQKMTFEQRKNAPQVLAGVLVDVKKPAKITPTATQLTQWKDAAQYGIWIDGKRVSNETLNNYQPSDFAHYSVSKLAKNAANYGKHYVQVDLSTPNYFEKVWKDRE